MEKPNYKAALLDLLEQAGEKDMRPLYHFAKGYLEAPPTDESTKTAAEMENLLQKAIGISDRLSEAHMAVSRAAFTLNNACNLLEDSKEAQQKLYNFESIGKGCDIVQYFLFEASSTLEQLETLADALYKSLRPSTMII